MFITQLFADATPLDSLTSLGAAGFMGAMWLWERRNSQKRESQLDEAHARIMGDHVQLEQLLMSHLCFLPFILTARASGIASRIGARATASTVARDAGDRL